MVWRKVQKSNKKQTRTIEQTKKGEEKRPSQETERESEDRLLLYTILNRGMPGLCKRNKRRKKNSF